MGRHNGHSRAAGQKQLDFALGYRATANDQHRAIAQIQEQREVAHGFA